MAGALAIAAASPPSRAHLKGALLLTELLPSPVKPLSAMTREPHISTIELASGGTALLAQPARGKGPAVVLVHGANIGGTDDPRVHDAVTALARLGRTVVAPSLALGERRLDRSDLVVIGDAIREASRIAGGRVVVLAFSFGAAFTLVALEQEPELQRSILQVMVVGTYFDLANLVSGVTTGKIDAGGEQASWSGAPAAPALVAMALAAQLEDQDRDAFLRALSERDPTGLSPEARSVYELMTNQDPGRVEELVMGLPAGIPQLFQDLSPSAHPELITVPVHALHSTEDPASPASESVRLVEAIASREESSVTVIGSLRHVTPTGRWASWLPDAQGLVSFTAKIFAPQERWIPSKGSG